MILHKTVLNLHNKCVINGMDIIITDHRLQGYYYSQNWVERSYRNNYLFEGLKIITIRLVIFFSEKKSSCM